MWTPLWVAHFAGNFALGLGRAGWLASFPFLEVLRDVAVPVLGILGILIVVWRAFAPRASIAGVTPAANKRQKLP
ncbi:MAG: hypothetical protein Q4G21_01820 [Dermabacter sp.]|nr:hypothetical protein [Dermabacter sp.]